MSEIPGTFTDGNGYMRCKKCMRMAVFRGSYITVVECKGCDEGVSICSCKPVAPAEEK